MTTKQSAYNKANNDCREYYAINRKSQNQYLNGEITIDERFAVMDRYKALNKAFDKAHKDLNGY